MGQTTRLDNCTYDILIALGKEADFLYSTVDTYIEVAKKDNRPHLVEIWNQMKRDKEKHLQMNIFRIMKRKLKKNSFTVIITSVLTLIATRKSPHTIS